MTNRPSVAPADSKRQQKGGGDQALTMLWVRFLVGAGSRHTEDIKNSSLFVRRGDVLWCTATA